MLNFLNIGNLEILLIIPFLLWIVLFLIAFIKCLSNRDFNPTEKAVWLLLIIIAPLLGAIAYLVAYGKPKSPTEQSY